MLKWQHAGLLALVLMSEQASADIVVPKDWTKEAGENETLVYNSPDQSLSIILFESKKLTSLDVIQKNTMDSAISDVGCKGLDDENVLNLFDVMRIEGRLIYALDQPVGCMIGTVKQAGNRARSYIVTGPNLSSENVHLNTVYEMMIQIGLGSTIG